MCSFLDYLYFGWTIFLSNSYRCGGKFFRVLICLKYLLFSYNSKIDNSFLFRILKTLLHCILLSDVAWCQSGFEPFLGNLSLYFFSFGKLCRFSFILGFWNFMFLRTELENFKNACYVLCQVFLSLVKRRYTIASI